MIDILPSDEQVEFVGSVVNALATPQDAANWKRLADLGCIGIALDEAVGGAGFDVADEALLHRALGRLLATPNVLAAALGARMAAEAGDPERARAIVEGDLAVAFAIPLDAEVSPERLSGAFHVLSADGDGLALAISARGATLAPIGAFGRRDPAVSTDDSLALVRAAGIAPALYGRDDADGPLWRRACLLIAAELAGIAEETLERSVAYAKIREQFGKPIGSFQAIGHHCANMALRAEAATSQLYFAAVALRDDRADAPLQVSAACLCAMDAAFHNATLAIQVHGGVGYSADSGLHRFLKRAVLLRHLAGGERTQELAVFHAQHDA